MTFSDCMADLAGQLNGNGQKGMLQIDAPPAENFWLRHWPKMTNRTQLNHMKITTSCDTHRPDRSLRQYRQKYK